MAYQALLFCPDEKTARTVTQVLSELDFQVSSCTEPFAAVKKLMAERFDAVVVDCDNEQNATLLFKSARNAPSNSSALAVAVVEGQAGVAKAFRIGANLVLTKPINVEQAKGTLRVARGLLRKNDSSKAAPASAAPAKSTTATSEPAKSSGPQATIPPRPIFSAPAAVASAPAPTMSAPANIVPEPKIEDGISLPSPDPAIATSSIQSAAQASATIVIDPPAAKPEAPVVKAQPVAYSNINASSGAQSGAASAPARALEPRDQSRSNAKAEPETSKSKIASEARIEHVEIEKAALPEKIVEAAVPAHTSGTTASETNASGSGKKVLLAVAAVVLIAAAGYWAWTQFGASHSAPGSSLQPVQRATPPSSPAPQAPIAASTTLPLPTSAMTAASSSLSANPVGESQASHAADASHVSAGHEKEPSPARIDAGSASAPKTSPARSSDEIAEAVHPIMVKSGTEILRSTKSQADTTAPQIAGIGAAQTGAGLSTLVNSGSEPAPVLQAMSVSQGVSQGLIIKKVSPSYPANAQRLRIEGQVELLATVSKRGDISTIKVLSGDPNLTRAAVDAVRQWKYKPYLLDGAPVEIQTQVTINFRLPR